MKRCEIVIHIYIYRTKSGRSELHSHMPLQQGPRFYISLESTCCLSDGFVLPIEREL